jgi:hypothetical protein
MAKKVERSGHNEPTIAAFIQGASESLWYFQATQWIDSPPERVGEQAASVFKAACEIIVKIVDAGYDEESDTWWPMTKLWPDEVDAQMVTLMLMDFGQMIERLPDMGIDVGGIKGFPVVSAGFRVFVGIICGPRWHQRFRSFINTRTQQERLERYARGEGRSSRRRLL